MCVGGGVGKGEKGREGGRLAVDIYAAGATFFVPYSDRRACRANQISE